MGKPNSTSVAADVTVAEVVISASEREGRDIFAINTGLRRAKEAYLAACQQTSLDGQTLVITIAARPE